MDEAARRAAIHLDALIRDLRIARLNACLSQRSVATALGVSRTLVSAWEGGTITPGPVQLYEWGAAVGLDVSVRAFPGGSPLRDAGQLRLLERFRQTIGDAWTWRTEVPVSSDPRDRRAFDAVISREYRRVAVEGVGRMVDSQGQVRPIELKLEASGLECVILVLFDSRQNRAALLAGRPTIEPAFPCPPRVALAALRKGEVPPGSAVVLV